MGFKRESRVRRDLSPTRGGGASMTPSTTSTAVFLKFLIFNVFL